MTKQNIVILIGQSHYHGLGLARCFGEKGIFPIGIVIGEHSNLFLESSKYWSVIHRVKTNTEAIELLISEYSNIDPKPVVIPWSDGALMELDNNYNTLKDFFLLSSIKNTQGEITRWMNKERQCEFATILNLPISPAMVVSFPIVTDEIERLQSSFKLPLFLKPVNSCEGSKGDMRIIESWKELKEYCSKLENSGFKHFLVQEYLRINTEIDLMGYCSAKGSSFTISEKLRIWPINGGAACFARTINSDWIMAVANKIVDAIVKFGYEGPFDIDLFQVGDDLYFNEVNWRSSANVYGAKSSGNNYPYLWYLYITGQELIESVKSKNIYYMNEMWDFNYVRNKKLAFFSWLKDYRKSDAYAFKDKNDIKPFFVRLLGGLLRKIGL